MENCSGLFVVDVLNDIENCSGLCVVYVLNDMENCSGLSVVDVLNDIENCSCNQWLPVIDVQTAIGNCINLRSKAVCCW